MAFCRAFSFSSACLARAAAINSFASALVSMCEVSTGAGWFSWISCLIRCSISPADGFPFWTSVIVAYTLAGNSLSMYVVQACWVRRSSSIISCCSSCCSCCLFTVLMSLSFWRRCSAFSSSSRVIWWAWRSPLSFSRSSVHLRIWDRAMVPVLADYSWIVAMACQVHCCSSDRSSSRIPSSSAACPVHSSLRQIPSNISSIIILK